MSTDELGMISLNVSGGQNPPKSKQKSVITDEQGKFTLPFQLESSMIACISDAGWARFVKKGEKPTIS